MTDFKFNKKGIADLEKRVQKGREKAEAEANEEAARESTPARKAHAFAKVLRKHGIENVNEAELKRKFRR